MKRRASLPLRAVRRLWRLATDPRFRHAMWLRAHPRSGRFQWANVTRADRYPYIFGFVRDALGADNPVNILSFGCSTGEEVFSLRRLFPQATIKGIDINPANVTVCRRRLRHAPDPGISFEVAASTATEASASYDAIFCMAVLRHGDLSRPDVTRSDPWLRFADFAAAVADFRRSLKAGGYLVIRFSNFRLCDTPDAACFATVLSVPYRARGDMPVFGPDNRLLEGVTYFDTVFRLEG